MEHVSNESRLAESYLANPLINFLSRANVYLHYGIYTSLIIYFGLRALLHLSFLRSCIDIMVGLISWTLIEYVIHRFAFHFDANSQFGKAVRFIFHDVHHAYPKKVSRSVTPLMFSLPIAFIFFTIFTLILNSNANAIFAGSLLGYILFTAMHDSTHHFAMSHPILKSLKRHHLRHHYFDTTKNFGVSTPIWDIVFGTYTK